MQRRRIGRVGRWVWLSKDLSGQGESMRIRGPPPGRFPSFEGQAQLPPKPLWDSLSAADVD